MSLYILCGVCGVDIKVYRIFLRLLKNKARVWTKEALISIVKSAPFKVYHLHSDNGSEFINSHLLHYCRENKITFTRSRVYVSNGNPHFENRNMVVVRRYTGYALYDSEKKGGGQEKCVLRFNHRRISPEKQHRGNV